MILQIQGYVLCISLKKYRAPLKILSNKLTIFKGAIQWEGEGQQNILFLNKITNICGTGRQKLFKKKRNIHIKTLNINLIRNETNF